MRKHIENKQKDKAMLTTFIKHHSTRLLKVLDFGNRIMWASSYNGWKAHLPENRTISFKI